MSFESPDLDTGDDERKRDSSRKRDGKREKREKGYQMFEAEDDDDEPLTLAEDLKSPSKQKKDRTKPTFKFPVSVRKEKTKDKDDKKDKEAKLEEKEKKKEEKEKKKHKKDKKKTKHGHKDAAPAIVAPSVTENPIFGVPLAVAVERNKSHDGIELPALVRECIDYIEEYGLACEGIYRMSGVKSKVHHLKECYNRAEPAHLLEHEPNVVASLLKLFLRELPEPVLTTQLMPKFEEASTIKNNKKKVEAFTHVIAILPTCNRLLLSWMIVHMTHVIELAKENKMSLQNVSIVLSPTMQISHRVLNVLFSNVAELFGDVQLRRYVPPLKPAHSKWSLELPDNLAALEEELAKQESLLNQLHAELHSGREDPEAAEQLWEVQRVVTQLKRKIKMGKKNVELVERRRSNIDTKRSSTSSLPSLSAPEELHLDLRAPPAPVTMVTTTVEVERQAVDKKGKRASQELGKEIEGGKEEGEKEAEESSGGDKDKQSTEGASGADVEKGETEQVAKKDGEKSNDGADKEAGGVNKGKGAGDEAEKPAEPKKGGKLTKAPQPEGKMPASKVEPGDKVEREAGKSEEEEKVKSEGDDKEAKTDVHKEVPEESSASKEDSKAEKAEDDAKVTEKGMSERDDSDKLEGHSSSTHDRAKVRSVEVKESEGEMTLQKGEKVKFAQQHSLTVEEGEVIEGPPTPTAETPAEQSEASAEKKEAKKSVKFAPEQEGASEEALKPVEKKEEEEPRQVPSAPPAPQEVATKQEPAAQSKPKPKVYEYRKAPNPPFVSTSLLKPMKAEPPKPRPAVEEVEGSSPQQETEKWRQLEEELLGQGQAEEDEAEIERLLEEEYALKLEEEELLAIGDELRQKLSTEHSEMERLTQEIQELQYLRQDSDLEDLSSASSSSEDSDDEEDLQDMLTQLIQDNQELEMQSADLCQKIHEERMICLSVKLQIRLLQQKQLESSYS